MSQFQKCRPTGVHTLSSPMCSTLHLDELKERFHVSHHSWRWYKSSCIMTLLAADSYNFVSSAEILHADFVNPGRSFMKIVNKIGPKVLPARDCL